MIKEIHLKEYKVIREYDPCQLENEINEAACHGFTVCKFQIETISVQKENCCHPCCETDTYYVVILVRDKKKECCH